MPRWSIESRTLSAWRKYIRGRHHRISFDNNNYEIVSRLIDETESKIHFKLWVNEYLDTLPTVANILLSHFSTFSKEFEIAIFEIALLQTIQTRMKLNQFIVPDEDGVEETKWMRMDSYYKVFFQKGPINVRLEIRGINRLRGGEEQEEPLKILQQWYMHLTVSGTTTAYQLKELVDTVKETKSVREGSAYLYELSEFTELQRSLIQLPIGLEIVEMKPYEIPLPPPVELFGPRSFGELEELRWHVVKKEMTKHFTDFPDGLTNWHCQLKKFPQVCDNFGTLKFVAYVVDGTGILM
jgi:hypothetical protein